MSYLHSILQAILNIIFLVIILVQFPLFSQAPLQTHNSAALEISSTTQGFLPPRMTDDQRDKIQNPAKGLVIYNSDIDQLETWNGSEWAVPGSTRFKTYKELQHLTSTNDVSPGDMIVTNELLYIRNSANDDWFVFEKSEMVYDADGLGYLTVKSSTGKIWLDRNLGATRVARTSTDHLAYGHLFQWGRSYDGHQKINWTGPNSGTPATGHTTVRADTPTHDLFIGGDSGIKDWRTTESNTLWDDGTIKGVNDPCPMGFRVPTRAELEEQMNSWSSSDSNGAFGIALKLPMAGKPPK
ncbi:MAG: hypothetical protein EBS74_05845 [Flavobacteriia bacterium]|nr:hypothetical protein [Flavobacteriia bacterium]